MNIRKLLLGSLSLFALTATSAVGAPLGWYLGFGAGYTTINTPKFTIGAPFGPATGSLSMGDTGAVNIATGYKFESHIRAELEFQYADFSADKLVPTGGAPVALNGNGSVESLFGNLYYDIPVSNHFQLNLGGGIGAAMFDPSMGDASANHLRGSQTEFSWQAIGGFTVNFSNRLELQADYRYQSIASSNHTYIAPASPVDLGDKNIQSVMLSLRWYLSEPTPPQLPPSPPPPLLPPSPPPPPPLVKTFVVFFDFNHYDLSAEAQQVIADAVQTAKQQGGVHVMVTGHTDTVGSASYNMELSERRANSVKAQMIADGMSESDIVTVGKGFNDPLVQTGPNVKEPQNRRAVIDLGG